MSLIVTLRCVGVYCFFNQVDVNKITLDASAPSGTPDPASLTADNTVKDVMLAFKYGGFGFSFESQVFNGKELVKSISYDFGADSNRPFNSSQPSQGSRSIANDFGEPTRIWQYYRSVSGRFDNVQDFSEIKLAEASYAQPSFAEQPLNAYFDNNISNIPSDFHLNNYNLTWRCLTIDMQPEAKAKFLEAHAKQLKS